MKHMHPYLLIAIVIAGLQLSACSAKPEAPVEAPPVQVQHLIGAQPTRLTLTADAAKRLDLQTDSVQVQTVGGVEQTVVPYASIVYDTEGHTWIYTSSDPLTYLRTEVEVESIDGDDAVIVAGLPNGTAVVTVGAEELFGSETEFLEE